MFIEKIVHNSHDSFYRFPFGAVPCGQKITIRLKVCDPGFYVEHAAVKLQSDKSTEEMVAMDMLEGSCGERVYQAEVKALEEPGLLWYFFIIQCSGKVYYYGNNTEKLGGAGGVFESEPNPYQITVYREGFKTPAWFKDAIMYQIMVDRFYNGNQDGSVPVHRKEYFIHENWGDTPHYKPDGSDSGIINKDFFGGNLNGIIKKLPYLKELGVGVIYLNPIFEASSNHKYNTGDYMKIDPMFGDEQIFKELIDSAKKLGISIILDGVFSHTGDDSLYFNREGNYPGVGAYQSTSSPYYKWYTFRHHPDDYECWWNFKTLPEVNELEPSYKEFILGDGDSVIRHWIRLGIRGWRLDVADELPDEFIKDLRSSVKSLDEDAVVIGEVWEDASNKVSYGKLRKYFSGDELDSVMNYSLKNGIIGFLAGKYSGTYLNRVIMSLYENYPMQSFYTLMNILGTHDTPRIKYELAGLELDQNPGYREREAAISLTEEQEALAKRRLYMASAFMMAFPGVPCIYYGDEPGLGGGHDPLNRGTYPWGSEDMELIEWYKKISCIRNNTDALRTGEYVPVHYGKDTFGFVRVIKNSTDVFGQKREDGLVVVLLNRSIDSRYDVLIDIREWGIHKLYDISGNMDELTSKDGCFNITVPPLQCLVLGA